MMNDNNNILEGIEPLENVNKPNILKGEKFLLLIAFGIAVLYDRLFLNYILKLGQYDDWNLFYFTAIFEICFTVVFCVFNYKKIYKKPLLWVIAGLIITLCVWNLIFDYASDYGILTFLVIPATLMMFAQGTTKNIVLKNINEMIIAWFSGWFIKPFIAIHKCIEVLLSVLFHKNKENKSVIIKILAAIMITIPLITILLALLSGADQVFGYYVNMIFSSFHIPDFILHAMLICIAFLLFYSFFWHGKYGKTDTISAENKIKKEYKADNFVLYIILGSVLILYILFCVIQFTYLFARAGLPEGITYSNYAREGFAQIVVISGINLIIFGCVLKFGKIHKPDEKDLSLKIMQYILIALTAIMLVSGFLRLKLYIDAEGMTFLRLISAWFIIYLSLVLIFCVARLIKAKLPVIACCAILLLFSYNILGYINPDDFITKYNLSEKYSHKYNRVDDWIEYSFYNLSDDALNALLDSEIELDNEKYHELLERRYNESLYKYSFSSMRLKHKLKDIFDK